MIRLPDASSLSAEAQYGLTVLLDLSRLVVGNGPTESVRLEVTEAVLPPGILPPADSITHADGLVQVPAATLVRAGALAGASVERASSLRDRFDRVPAAANPLVIGGVERAPILSELGGVLRCAAAAAAGTRSFRVAAPWPDGRRWAVALTHDLDVVVGWPAFTLLRLAELIRKGEGRRIGLVLGAALAALGRDPVVAGIEALLAIEADAAIRSTWFVICGTPTARSWHQGDITYQPESARTRWIITAIQRAGHELGLHGSFDTSDTTTLFSEQRTRLQGLTGAPIAGVRQHFLKMRPGETQEAMAAAGFTFDASFGFADRNGFRLGAADLLPLPDRFGFDLAPFCWMDRALSKYRGIESPGAWVDDALALADVCRSCEGLWSGIWHPNLTAALGFPGGLEAYADLVKGLLSRGGPWTAPLGPIVDWRRGRREIRALGVRADGSVDAVAPGVFAGSYWLEDAHGNCRERVGTSAL
ncbi:MAG: hypothetical protein ACHQXA_06705 [Gemmatimonadales bacterium]